ncbi:C4-dicarboxylate-binding protein DctP [Arthrobacter subterraneus]|uniref:C4-dicarboxylate-binding protein DctP n=1 Tax=Arthrobacter subterraneus TaxID=335973 RepID=A0A1G8HSN7_9MICC|nr:DctP family TRAP transporter solute-binding subunit [Arthrobacter subterraneus]SDI09634.1 C4-dicarboxylate-binding protein DctP [Arthrobacter subterraneus]
MKKVSPRSRALAGIGLALSAALVLSGCGGARSGDAAGDESFTIKFSHVTTANTPKGKAAEKFKEILEDSSDGRITVEIYPNSELYGDKDELQALQSNSVQMIAPSSSKFTTIAPQLQLLDLPFLFDTSEDIPTLASRDSVIGDVIYENEDLKSKNVQVLGLWDNGLKQLSANTELRTPEDTKGLSFRIQPADVLASQFEAWGGATSTMAFAEVYNGLQQGVIDGQENTYSNIETQKMHTVQKFLTESDHGYIGYVTAINSEFFDSLPEDLQQLVIDAMDEASAYNREVATEVNEEAKQAIIEEGSTEIVTLTEEERQAWKDAVVPSVWEEHKDVLGPEIIDGLLAERDK